MGLFERVGRLGKKSVNASVDQAKKVLGVRDVKENYNWILKLGKGLMPSSVKAGRVETFDAAMERQSVTLEDLERIYINHVLRFWIGCVMLVVGFVIAIKLTFNGDFFILLPIVGFSAICLSLMFSGSFRAYQISRRRFFDVSEWVKDKSAWIPASFALPKPIEKKNINKKSSMTTTKEKS